MKKTKEVWGPVVEYKDIKFTGFDYGKLNQIISEVSNK